MQTRYYYAMAKQLGPSPMFGMEYVSEAASLNPSSAPELTDMIPSPGQQSGAVSSVVSIAWGCAF